MTSRWPAAALVATLLLGAGCGRRRPAEPPQDLDPQAVLGIPEHRILMALFEGLVAQDPRDLHPVPGLAESWDISPDGLVYTFHLRPGLRWSNGDPLTAGDFIRSYRRILAPAFASEYAYSIYQYVRGAEAYCSGRLTDFSRVGFRSPDRRTLQVTLKHPAPYLLKVIASNPSWDAVPVEVIARFGPVDRKGNAWTRPGNLVGSGPFELRSWKPDQKIVLRRNPFYWDAAHVRLDEIDFFPVEDPAVEERMFRDGQLDVTNDLPFGKIDVYRRDHPGELHVEPWLGVYYYVCNVRRPPLNDPRVRRALALSIDRGQIVRDVTRGGQRPAYSVSYPGNAGYVPRARLAFDLAEARRLLAAAGFPGGRGFPGLSLLFNTDSQHRQIAEAVQAMWRRNLGIEITLRNQEWKVYLDAMQSHDFQLVRLGSIADYADPQVFLENWESHNENDYAQWSDPRYDRLFQDALAARGNAERYAIFQKMDAILVDQCPVIPIYDYTRTYAMSPRVRGWWPTLLDDHPWKYVYLAR